MQGAMNKVGTNVTVTLALVSVISAGATGCRTMLGIHGATKSEEAKIHQRVGPIDQRGVALHDLLRVIANSASLPVVIDVCAALANERVTVVTTQAEDLGLLVQSAALQVGAPVRLLLGNHGEVARPTLFCPDGRGALLAIQGDREAGRRAP
jgi:hypothetical protein